MTARQTVQLYPWFKFCQNLLFWQAIWFLYFQSTLSAAEAILLYAVYDIASTALEVPSGYMSDRIGRRFTLIVAMLCGALGALVLAIGGSFALLALGQVALGAAAAFASGTDSAILYESLAADGRADEIEAHELRAWRFGFVALALSAVTGGVMGLASPALPFVAGALATLGALLIALRMTEPPAADRSLPQGGEWTRLASLGDAFRNPVLLWLFALSVLMYGYSHIPFVFGQPFILEALAGIGLAAQAPVISGAVSSVMMGLSVLVSLFAMRLRLAIGLPAILLLAFAMQIGLAGVLALTNSALAIAFLFLRMVPNSLSRPFIQARIQPALKNDTRATYLSLQSLVGRLLFSASLFLAASGSSATSEMSYGEIRLILAGYALAGLVCLAVLAWSARRVALEPARQ